LRELTECQKSLFLFERYSIAGQRVRHPKRFRDILFICQKLLHGWLWNLRDIAIVESEDTVPIASAIRMQ